MEKPLKCAYLASDRIWISCWELLFVFINIPRSTRPTPKYWPIRENSKLIRGTRAVCQDQMAELPILGGLAFFI